MKILVLSDSHSSLRFMRSSIEKLKPDAVLHLGDFFDDGQAMAQEHPDMVFYQVPGNCDRFRCPPGQPEVLQVNLWGVMLYLTHGHRHGVKMGRGRLVQDARTTGADAVLYGHTHEAYCSLEDGMWVVNPGSCGHSGGSVALLEVENGNITLCRILRQEDLEEMV